MRLDVVFLAKDLQPEHLNQRAVVVFDVLRATTSMAAALHAGATEIQIYPNTNAALAAGAAFKGSRLLCGEEQCLPPLGFDVGNSPAAFVPALCASRTILMSTTNGTRAIYAAKGASEMFMGALVNAAATAEALLAAELDTTLLCAGTNGVVAMEDILGAGAVICEIERMTQITPQSDNVAIARQLFHSCRDNLLSHLRQTRGGENIIRAGLEPDIEFASRLNFLAVAGKVSGEPPTVRRVR
ncbi:MAG TPA: 2-phosphosulfolactate phosphatase [Humisphaera sp.]|jgi:2-phosphosulfolactate phosphatase|nr:2-phosphosulfolactate phosphatase [Humisphaera sp.]